MNRIAQYLRMINFLNLLRIFIGIVSLVVITLVLFRLLRKDKAMSLMKRYLENKNYQKALRVGIQYLKDNPNDYMAKYQIAEAYEGLGNLEEAISYYEKASIAASITGNEYMNPQIFLKLGKIFMQKGKFREALGYFKLILEKQPTHIKALYKISEVLYRIKNYDKAKEYISKLVKLKPDYLKAVFLYANVLYKLKDYNSAIHQLQVVVEKLTVNDKMYSEALLLLADAYAKNKLWDKSINTLYSLLNNKEYFERVFYKIVNVYISSNKKMEAISFIENKLSFLKPNQKTEMLYLTADMYFKLGEYYKAVQNWRKAA